MPELHPPENRDFQVEREKPLIGVLVPRGDREMIEYFTDEEAAEAALPTTSVQKALSLLGAWKDIDSDDALEQLDRIRHESKPTPPIEL